MPVGVVELLVEEELVVDPGGVNVNEAVCPGKIPKSRSRSVLAESTST
jgi:hypothetical protein